MADKSDIKLLKAEQKKLKFELKLQEKKNAEIRDQMAIERALFANERTFMAYLRTAMTLVAAGITLLKVFDDPLLKTIGIILLPAGLITTGIGLYRFVYKKRLLGKQKDDYTPTSHHYAKNDKQEAPSPETLRKE